MAEKFKWQHIMFADGSNPYLCMTREKFEVLQQRYELKLLKYGFWLAIEKKEVVYVY